MKAAQVEKIGPAMARHSARLEVLIANMIDRGWLSADEIDLELVSTFSRNWAKDIQQAKVRDRKQGPILHLKVNREGLFDQLPPNFFHQPDPHLPGQKLEQRLADSQAIRDEEVETRKFFHPFEQMLFRFRLQIEQNESKLADGFTSPLRTALLLSLWPNCKQISPSFYPLLSYVLPLSYRVAGDLHLMSVCYATVLRVPARFEKITNHKPDTPSDNLASGSLLGQNFELAGKSSSSIPALKLTLGPCDRSTAHTFLPGGEHESLLELLNDSLVPIEYDLKLAVEIEAETDVFQLGDRNTPAPALGCHTRLAQTAMP